MDEALLADGHKFAEWITTSPEELAKHNPFTAKFEYRVADIRPGEGYAKIRFQIGREFTNFLKIVHGGVVAAMLDETASIAAMSVVGWSFRGTVCLNVGYIAPTQPGIVIGESKLIGTSKSLMFLDASLSAESGEIYAHASLTVAYVPGKKVTS